jgi:hypothetical protein
MAFQVPIRRGEAHPRAKLTDQQRDSCRERFRAGQGSIADLAREQGISARQMSRIVHQPSILKAGFRR